MLFVVLVGLIVVIIVIEICCLFWGFKGIKFVELIQLINVGGMVVVDLLVSGDFEKGYIVGSCNVQVSVFGLENKLVVNVKQLLVVLVCCSGNVLEIVVKVLKKVGFEKVYVFDGGIFVWQQVELLLVKGCN